MEHVETTSDSSTPDVEEAQKVRRKQPSKKPNMSINSALRDVDDKTQAKLDSRKSSSLARAMTSQVSRELSLVDMAKHEAEMELPQSVRDFAAAVFQAVAGENDSLSVDGELPRALEMIGHNTNDQALKDICSRFNLEYPEHHEIDDENDNERAEAVEGGESKKMVDKTADQKSKRELRKALREPGLRDSLELDVFLAIIYSELIDQAQPADLAKSFGLFDKDGNGEIDMNEFEAGLMALGDMNPLDIEGRKAFLKKIDVDGDDTLSSKELVNWLANDTFEEFKAKADEVSGVLTGPRAKPRTKPRKKLM